MVEGYHDLAKLKSIYSDIDIVITNGSEVSEETLEELKLLNQSRGLILFLDPDYQGERIRRLINDYVGETKHAFLKKSQCINKNRTKVGIEHANKEDIVKALEAVYTVKSMESGTLLIQDLFELKLVGNVNAKHNRKKVCEELRIGLANGKTLVKKLNMFNISKEIVKRIIEGE